jgi:plastocyanin
MRTSGTWPAGLLAALAAASHCTAATLAISVVDDDGKPIADVAVYATAHGAAAAASSSGPPPRATMDQQNHQFVPHMLVIQAGTEVIFPNSDNVSHHVYSFSPTKTFELGLYKGNVYPPVTFDEPGIVVLGCNIHDGMLGYIRVVDTPYFAVTNAEGVARIEGVSSGDYSVEAWTPRVRPQEAPAAQHVVVADAETRAEIRVTGRLALAHVHGKSSLTWDRY